MKPSFTAQTVLTNQSFSHRQLQRLKNEDAPTNEGARGEGQGKRKNMYQLQVYKTLSRYRSDKLSHINN